MSSVQTTNTSVMNYDEETELTLGLPGESRGVLKRMFSNSTISEKNYKVINKAAGSTEKKGKSVAVVGWPPVKELRKSVIMRGGGKYVKVAVDGVPYLRKVDLQNFDSYDKLLSALQDLFGCSFMSVCSNGLNEKKLMDCVNGALEYVPTYEDKDGDWMLLGDVPWNMFAQSCKRLRLMTRNPLKC